LFVTFLNKIILKLNRNRDGVIDYWETWDNDDKSATVHWGQLGQRGENKIVKSELLSSFRKKVQKEIDEKIKLVSS